MIRRYKNDDADAVVAAWRVASDRAHPFLTTAFLNQEAENLRNIYLAYAETWVTEINGDVVGFIAMIDREIGGLFLDPLFHGMGLGKSMVDKAIAEKGPLTVEVFKENTIGRRFYDLYGFRQTAESVHEATGHETIKMAFTPN